MPFQPYDTGRPAVQEAARTLSHGDEFLTKLLLDAWHHHMNVEDYISVLMRPQNPGPYVRRIRSLGNEADRLRYYHARPPHDADSGEEKTEMSRTTAGGGAKWDGGEEETVGRSGTVGRGNTFALRAS
jgi:hypothetical protein